MKKIISYIYEKRRPFFYLFLLTVIIFLLYKESRFTNASQAIFYFDKKQNAYQHFIFFEKDSICDSVVIKDIDVKTTGTITLPNGKVLEYENYVMPVSNLVYESQIAGDTVCLKIYEEEGETIVDTNALFLILPVELYYHGHLVEKELVRVYEKKFKNEPKPSLAFYKSI